MTVIIACAAVVLVAAALLVMRVRHERERSAMIDAAWQRMAASGSRLTFIDTLRRRDAEDAEQQAARAIADKLIPRLGRSTPRGSAADRMNESPTRARSRQ